MPFENPLGEEPPGSELAADLPVESAPPAGVATGTVAPPIDGGDAPVAPAELRRAAVKVATAASGVVTGAVPEAIADTGAALRRTKMQLYSRMMTDLSVLTQNERLPTDAEIHEALRRAARAQGLPLRPAGSPEAAHETRGMASSRRIDEHPGTAIPDQFVVPADQSRQTISGTGTVEDFVRGKGEPENGNPATRLSKVNAYLKKVTAENAALAAIEQSKRKFGLAGDAGHDLASSLNYSYASARVGYDLASLAAASRSFAAANPDSPESDKIYLLDFADTLEKASIAMSGGRWIDANSNPGFFSYDRIDYPDFNAAYQARILNQSRQPSISALTPEMIEERQKIELDRQVMANRNDALPSFAEQTYFQARARGASLDELQRQIARGQFMDATLGVAGAAAAPGAVRGSMSQIRPLEGYRPIVTEPGGPPPGPAQGSFFDLSRAAEYRPGIYRAHPGAIRFGQHVASPNFGNGGTIRELAAELRNGKSPDLVGAPIRIIIKDGKLFTLDNRRLVAFKAARIDNIPIQLISIDDPIVIALISNPTRMDPIAGEGRSIVIAPTRGQFNQDAARNSLHEHGLIKSGRKR